MYGNYSRVYNDCIAAMEVAEAKSKLYKELLVELVQEPLCKCLPFAGYLIQPIQRLPRYVMLLSVCFLFYIISLKFFRILVRHNLMKSQFFFVFDIK